MIWYEVRRTVQKGWNDMCIGDGLDTGRMGFEVLWVWEV